MNPATKAVADARAPFSRPAAWITSRANSCGALQSERLRQVVERAYEHVPVYHQKMQKRGLRRPIFADLDDIAQLPFTTESDLSDAYPLDCWPCPSGKWCV